MTTHSMAPAPSAWRFTLPLPRLGDISRASPSLRRTGPQFTHTCEGQAHRKQVGDYTCGGLLTAGK